MKAVIFNAFKPNEDNDIPGMLSGLLAQRGWETQTFHLNEMDIKPCSSCGHCAAKTPGLCSIKDDMDTIFAAWAQCQLMIFCTPVSFGGYHSDFKIFEDRFMPMNTALFTIRRGELHHKNRYQPTPSLMTVGLLDNNLTGEKEVFEYLTERNAINFNTDRWISVVLTQEEQSEEKLAHQLEEALEEVV